MQDAIVIAAEVGPGTGSLAEEPVTTATLRGVHDGRDRVVRIVGGPTRRGGFARLAGYVVPVTGARVRLDLRQESRLVGLPLPGPTWTTSTPPGTWASANMPITFILALPPSRDIGAAAAAELDVALRTWQRPPCTSLRTRFGGVEPALSGDDGENGVFFHDTTWPEALDPNAVAQTILHEDGSGTLRDADIHVNGASFRFSIDGTWGTEDIRSVFVHELGHAIGLGHSSDPRATMSASGSGLRRRSLEKDDVDGVCALYPGSGPPPTCDTTPCPSGFLCVAGACQRPHERSDVCAPCAPEPGACEAAGDDARCIDIGSGENAGRVCGRACVMDTDCGAGFACRPTTEAGDRQCVSLDDCRNGGSRCASDTDCTQAATVCRNGACVAPRAEIADAGPSDAGRSDVSAASGEACSCRSPQGSRSRSSAALPLLALALLAIRRHSASTLASFLCFFSSGAFSFFLA
ncbi:MAG TPA: matrixin family metalloprotease [Labilithrix sp.]|nr:matrixin family metalloprotease [Labilithrix sp.]